MKSPEDEFIAHISAQLHAHEEQYLAGAWERFNQKDEERRVLPLWLRYVTGAAAVLFVGFGVALYSYMKTEHPVSVVNNSNNPAYPKVELAPQPPRESSGKFGTPPAPETNPMASSTVEMAKPNDAAILSASAHHRTTSSESIVGLPEKAAGIEGAKNQLAANVNQPLAVSAKFPVQKTDIELDLPLEMKGKNTTSPASATQKKDPVKQSFEEFLKAESIKPQPMMAKTTKQQDKWEVGVMVAPSFGNAKKINMGYGLSMAYALSDKVSISSGLAYNEMGASKENIGNGGASDAPVMTSLASSTRSLQSVDARLTGIDIPLEIRYRFNKKLYANAGLSAFAVLNQRQQNNFIENNVETVPSDFTGGNTATFRTMVVSRRVSETVPKDEVKEDQYLGFYNFSFGYQQKVFGGKSFAVEPFVKLPIKQFTRENLYLIGTGLKLKFDF